MPTVCAMCARRACEALTVIPACEECWDDPERAIGVLAECAGALVNLMEDRTSERNIQFAEIALGRLRAMRYLPTPP